MRRKIAQVQDLRFHWLSSPPYPQAWGEQNLTPPDLGGRGGECVSPKVTTAVVLIDALVSILHGLAHAKIPVPLSSLQQLFVNIVIVAAPAIALLLFWTPLQRWGASLLLGSMTRALIFGIYNHSITQLGEPTR
jgi:hypothetical protein